MEAGKDAVFAEICARLDGKDMNINELQRLCEIDAVRWTDHAIKRMIQRGISQADVKRTLTGGEIIEQYPDDYPYPSCLVLGNVPKDRPLHVVCGVGSEELWIISAYYPDPERWSDGFEKRKGP
jgi:hypothetical protein